MIVYGLFLVIIAIGIIFIIWKGIKKKDKIGKLGRSVSLQRRVRDKDEVDDLENNSVDVVLPIGSYIFRANVTGMSMMKG